jgi:AcrR family transcriptional regulator
MPGLREHKKQRTRQLIADTAWTLFADRGFERVTVADVARAAEVSEATVFNYFGSKEDLFFVRLEEHGERLVAAIAGRRADESVLDAFRRFVLADAGGLIAQVDAGDRHALDRLRTVNRVMASSPSLRARESRSFAQTADALAAHLAREADPDEAYAAIRASVVAQAVIGVQRTLVSHVREMVLAGRRPASFVRDVQAAGEAACTQLERGLGSYGRRSRRRTTRKGADNSPVPAARR